MRAAFASNGNPFLPYVFAPRLFCESLDASVRNNTDVVHVPATGKQKEQQTYGTRMPPLQTKRRRNVRGRDLSRQVNLAPLAPDTYVCNVQLLIIGLHSMSSMKSSFVYMISHQSAWRRTSLEGSGQPANIREHEKYQEYATVRTVVVIVDTPLKTISIVRDNFAAPQVYGGSC